MGKKVNFVRKLIPARRVDNYGLFDQIDGRHPWEQVAPDSYVKYDVRLRKQGRVVYFNYILAKEMGLIHKNHEYKMNPKLEKKLLDVFSIQIINEYDIEKGKRFNKKDIKPNKYLATRYLQIQHKCKLGTTSGDGRGIWNGQVRQGGSTWDVSSCGTGVTRLSPGFVQEGNAIETGSDKYSYGSGRAGLDEGILDSIFSGTLHEKGIETERVLVVIGFPDNSAIKVRVARSLLRPSHFFNNLRQNNLNALNSSIDFLIDQQIRNRKWSINRRGVKKYDQLLELLTGSYAKLAALFEHLYVFFWAEWDGDNMLIEGGIVDYGSIRQFGLCHHKYRYDDSDRWSTSLLEQKKKIRYIVQALAQLVDYLNTGDKKNISSFSNHPCLQKFDRIFKEEKNDRVLSCLGLNKKYRKYILENHIKLADEFVENFSYFERKTQKGKAVEVMDGINCEAIYDIKNILYKLPAHFYNDSKLMSVNDFLDHLKSEYTPAWALKENNGIKKKVMDFQKCYLNILNEVSQRFSKKNIFLEVSTQLSNSVGKVPLTGDAAIYIVEKILDVRKKFNRNELNRIIDAIVYMQYPGRFPSKLSDLPGLSKTQKEFLKEVKDIIFKYRHSI